jgi:hypothetical protein
LCSEEKETKPASKKLILSVSYLPLTILPNPTSKLIDSMNAVEDFNQKKIYFQKIKKSHLKIIFSLKIPLFFLVICSKLEIIII